jgi:hypothetical protein
MFNDSMELMEAMILQEAELNLFSSIENFEYRLDEWKQGKIRALFLCGLSGSGKTTYGRSLATENNCTLVSLDNYLKPLLRQKYGQFSSEEYHQKVFDYGTEELLAANPSGKVIFEGGQICWMDPDKLKDHAVIIVGTSFLTSTWRAVLRDFSKEHWEQYGHIAPHVHTAFNMKTFLPLRKVLSHLQKIKTNED